jgi:cysteine desulfurase
MRFFNHVFGFGQDAYLDYASSTPIDRRMRRSIPRVSTHANPNALHKDGVVLGRILEESRVRVSKILDVHADEIIFTSGATESDNLAILGTLNQWMKDGIDPKDIIVFSSELEHASVSEVINTFIQKGIQHNIFPIDDGVVNGKYVIIPDNAKAVFVSVMYVSNEIGTVQPIADIAKRIRKLKKLHPDVQFVFHTDATQAPAHLPLRIPTLGVDLMTLGATKLYCTKGVGVLYKKKAIKLMPIMYGGGQERGLRPGTQPVELIHEFSYALEHAVSIQEKETERIKELRDYFEEKVTSTFPQVTITAKKLPRSPHITHIGVPKFDSELLVLELDVRGVAVSAKSACKNEEGNESPVVEKLYGPGWGAIRFSFGRMTTKRELDKATKALRSVFKKYIK